MRVKNRNDCIEQKNIFDEDTYNEIFDEDTYNESNNNIDCRHYHSNNESRTEHATINHDDFILPASDLGIGDDRMYARLISILEGEEITPEDYEILLQLDNNNVKKTMDRSEISSYPIIVLGINDNK